MGIFFSRLAGPILVLFALFVTQASHAQENTPPVEGDCLIRLLGEHINNENVQELIEYMGIQPPFHHLRGREIISAEKGIKIVFDAEFRLAAIILFNSNYISGNITFSKFSGQLPFKLTFKESNSELLAKLGKPAKVKKFTDSTSYSFKQDLQVIALCDNTGADAGEFFYISFVLKKKDSTYPFPDKLNCDSIAKQ